MAIGRHMRFPHSPPPSPEMVIADNLTAAITGRRFLKFAEEHPLDPKHFLYKNSFGLTPLQAAANHGRLGEIFSPSYWQGRVGPMIDLWNHLEEEDRAGFDFNALRDRAIHQNLPPLPKFNPADFTNAASSFSLGAIFNKVFPGKERA